MSRSHSILSVVGARPNFIKASVVSEALLRDGYFDETMVHTGQHYDYNMSGLFFEELGLPEPTYHLGIGSGFPSQQTGRMMEAFEAVCLERKPDWVLIYGDTNSTMAAALVASKLYIPCAHVEAGARSFNRRMPEEINRVVADHLSTLLFANTLSCVENLAREGIDRSRCSFVGDVMYDAALRFGAIAEAKSKILADLSLQPGKYALVTIHRAENTDDPARLRVIVRALTVVAEQCPVIFPLHPRTKKMWQALDLQCPSGLRMIDPLGYLDMLQLEKHSAVIATDSGGVQREAFFSRIPCVTLRDETELTELVDLGWNRLVRPTDVDLIADAIVSSIGCIGTEGNPFGDGAAATKIAAAIR